MGDMELIDGRALQNVSRGNATVSGPVDTITEEGSALGQLPDESWGEVGRALHNGDLVNEDELSEPAESQKGDGGEDGVLLTEDKEEVYLSTGEELKRMASPL